MQTLLTLLDKSSPLEENSGFIAVSVPITLVNTMGSISYFFMYRLLNENRKESKDIKELTESLLLEDNVNIYKYLEHVNFSKMDKTIPKIEESDPIRIGRSSGYVPVNTAKTREHLNNVFVESSDELRVQLSEMINNRDNYSECPNINNTESGRFSVQGWRNILALCVGPETDQSHLDEEVTSGLIQTTAPPSYDTIQLLPTPTYSSVTSV